jgi:hypothetical protein
MAKSALIAVAVALLLGGTSLAAAKTRNAAGAHRSPSHLGVNEEVTASPRPTAANPYYRLIRIAACTTSLPCRRTFRVTPTVTRECRCGDPGRRGDFDLFDRLADLQTCRKSQGR